MALMFHVGAGRPTVDSGWANNGSNEGFEYLFLCATQAHQVPQVALAALIMGGVLERHPSLIVFTAEFGIGWLPDWLHSMDVLATGAISEFRPVQYRLPLRPSEYAARQLFVTPLPGQAIRPTIDQTPPGMVTFATDYPHPEGAADCLDLFTDQMSGLSDDSIAAFLGDRVAVAMGLGAATH
jgi:predicted TIM-barrel fold metal-dependent hydrolase